MANSTASPERSTALAPPRILICGRDGIGKTAFAADSNSGDSSLLILPYLPERPSKNALAFSTGNALSISLLKSFRTPS